MKSDHLAWAKRMMPHIPESIATIEDAYQAPLKEAAALKTLILIQDAHTNNSGQLNTAKTLDLIFQAAPKISYVFLEAGQGNESLSFLRKYTPLEERERLAKSYLVKGQLQGSEYLDLTSDHKFTLWGVEDMDLYLESLEIYRSIATQRERFESYLQRVEATIQTLKPKVYNPFLLSFDKVAQSADTDLLVREAQKLSLSMDAYPNIKALTHLKELESKIDFKKAGEEPELSKYFHYLKESKKIQARGILIEQIKLVDEIYQTLTATQDEESLIQASRNVETLKELLFLRLTPDQFNRYQNEKRSFDITRITGFLNKKIMDLKNHYDETIYLENGYEDVIRKCEEFYSLTYQRDQKFIQNAAKKINEGRQDTAVLIAGGYHSPNLKYLLKEQGISYIVLTPQIIQETNQGRYERLLLGQSLKEVTRSHMNTTREITYNANGGRLAMLSDFSGRNPEKAAVEWVGQRQSTLVGARLAVERPYLWVKESSLNQAPPFYLGIYLKAKDTFRDSLLISDELEQIFEKYEGPFDLKSVINFIYTTSKDFLLKQPRADWPYCCGLATDAALLGFEIINEKLPPESRIQVKGRIYEFGDYWHRFVRVFVDGDAYVFDPTFEQFPDIAMKSALQRMQEPTGARLAGVRPDENNPDMRSKMPADLWGKADKTPGAFVDKAIEILTEYPTGARLAGGLNSFLEATPENYDVYYEAHLERHLENIVTLLNGVRKSGVKRKDVNAAISLELRQINRSGRGIFNEKQANKIASIRKLEERIDRLKLLTAKDGSKYIFKGSHIAQILQSSRTEPEITVLIKLLNDLQISEGYHIASILQSSRTTPEITALIKLLKDLQITEGYHIAQILQSSRTESEITTLIKLLNDLQITEGYHIAQILLSSRTESEIITLIKLLKDLQITEGTHIGQIVHSSRTEPELEALIKLLNDLHITEGYHISQILRSSRTEVEIKDLTEIFRGMGIRKNSYMVRLIVSAKINGASSVPTIRGNIFARPGSVLDRSKRNIVDISGRNNSASEVIPGAAVDLFEGLEKILDTNEAVFMRYDYATDGSDEEIARHFKMTIAEVTETRAKIFDKLERMNPDAPSGARLADEVENEDELIFVLHVYDAKQAEGSFAITQRPEAAPGIIGVQFNKETATLTVDFGGGKKIELQNYKAILKKDREEEAPKEGILVLSKHELTLADLRFELGRQSRAIEAVSAEFVTTSPKVLKLDLRGFMNGDTKSTDALFVDWLIHSMHQGKKRGALLVLEHATISQVTDILERASTLYPVEKLIYLNELTLPDSHKDANSVNIVALDSEKMYSLENEGELHLFAKALGKNNLHNVTALIQAALIEAEIGLPGIKNVRNLERLRDAYRALGVEVGTDDLGNFADFLQGVGLTSEKIKRWAIGSFKIDEILRAYALGARMAAQSA